MATSLVHHLAFPTIKNPTKAKINDITQIDFFIKTLNGPDLIEIWSLNNLQSSAEGYFWCSMPAAYAIYLSRAFFRLENLKCAVKHGKGEIAVMVALKQHLIHLDTTLDTIWEEAWEAEKNHQMVGNWRCKTLDQWLTIEFYIQRHNTFDIEVFIEEDSGNMEKLKQDPFDLGMLYI